MTDHHQTTSEISQIAGHPPITAGDSISAMHARAGSHQERASSERLDRWIAIGMIAIGIGAGVVGFMIMSDGRYHGTGPAKMMLAGLIAAVWAIVWIWRSRRKIAVAASNAALDAAATGLRAGRAIASKGNTIAAEIKRRADQD